MLFTLSKTALFTATRFGACPFKCLLTSTLLGKVICNKWFTWTSMHLGRSGGAFSSKTNVIHCVFSGSDVGNKWWLLCSLLHPTTKHHNRLGDNLVSLLQRWNNGGLLTAHSGWVYVKTPVSIKNRGRGLCRTTSLCQKSQNSLIWESDHYYWGFKKEKALGGLLSL